MTSVLLLEAGGPESGALAATAAAGYQVHAAITPDQHAGYGQDLRRLLAGCLLTDFSRHEHAHAEVIDHARRIGSGPQVRSASTVARSP